MEIIRGRLYCSIICIIFLNISFTLPNNLNWIFKQTCRKYNRFSFTFLCIGTSRTKSEVRSHMVKGKVVILPTRVKIVCRNTHKLTTRVLVFQENNNIIACIGLMLASFTL